MRRQRRSLTAPREGRERERERERERFSRRPKKHLACWCKPTCVRVRGRVRVREGRRRAGAATADRTTHLCSHTRVLSSVSHLDVRPADFSFLISKVRDRPELLPVCSKLWPSRLGPLCVRSLTLVTSPRRSSRHGPRAYGCMRTHSPRARSHCTRGRACGPPAVHPAHAASTAASVPVDERAPGERWPLRRWPRFASLFLFTLNSSAFLFFGLELSRRIDGEPSFLLGY